LPVSFSSFVSVLDITRRHNENWNLLSRSHRRSDLSSLSRINNTRHLDNSGSGRRRWRRCSAKRIISIASRGRRKRSNRITTIVVGLLGKLHLTTTNTCTNEDDDSDENRNTNDKTTKINNKLVSKIIVFVIVVPSRSLLGLLLTSLTSVTLVANACIITCDLEP